MRPNPFRKYHGFIKGSFLNFVAFRTEILGWVLQDIITLFIMVFLWFAIYKESSNETINGFTYPSNDDVLGHRLLIGPMDRERHHLSRNRPGYQPREHRDLVDPARLLPRPKVRDEPRKRAWKLPHLLFADGPHRVFDLHLRLRPARPNVVQHAALSRRRIFGDRHSRLVRFHGRPIRFPHQFLVWDLSHQELHYHLPFGRGDPLLFLPELGPSQFWSICLSRGSPRPRSTFF
jgi:TM2 domain-containing membrane protein YozV